MEKLLKSVLGGTYGGPSISFEDNKFVLYDWGDAPVCMDILVSDPSWKKFVEKLKEWKAKESK